MAVIGFIFLRHDLVAVFVIIVMWIEVWRIVISVYMWRCCESVGSVVIGVVTCGCFCCDIGDVVVASVAAVGGDTGDAVITLVAAIGWDLSSCNRPWQQTTVNDRVLSILTCMY